MREMLDGVPVEQRDDVKCIFGCRDMMATARFKMSQGCVALPNELVQDLCLQHIVKATPLGDMEMDLIYVPENIVLLNSK